MLCIVPKRKQAWRNWSILKDNPSKAHQLAYPNMQENRKPQCEFTDYTGMSNNVQASGQQFAQQKDETKIRVY